MESVDQTLETRALQRPRSRRGVYALTLGAAATALLATGYVYAPSISSGLFGENATTNGSVRRVSLLDIDTSSGRIASPKERERLTAPAPVPAPVGVEAVAGTADTPRVSVAGSANGYARVPRSSSWSFDRLGRPFHSGGGFRNPPPTRFAYAARPRPATARFEARTTDGQKAVVRKAEAPSVAPPRAVKTSRAFIRTPAAVALARPARPAKVHNPSPAKPNVPQGDPFAVAVTPPPPAPDLIASIASAYAGRDEAETAPILTRIATPSARPARPRIPEVRAVEPQEEYSLPRDGAPLARFYAKLEALRAGRRSRPVTILHIGDSHIANDSFTKGIRKRLQATYGDAGRGPMIPPKVFPFARAAQVKMTRSGPWKSFYSLKNKGGPYGISGVRVSSASRSAKLNVSSENGAFDFVEVTMVTGPSAGGVTISAGGESKTFSARSSRTGSKTVRLSARAKSATVRPSGGGTTSILHWSTGRDRPGVRYVNFGQVGATVNVTKRWNDAILADDLKAMKPDLIVYGYGTNEGFNSRLNLAAYRKYATAFVRKMQRAAPGADIAFIGAADGASRRTKRGSRCRGGYVTPVRLGGVRDTLRKMARDMGAGYWDWAAAMGGRCSVDRWAGQGLAAKDRVHLTGKGYDRSAGLFVSGLLDPASGGGRRVARR